MSEEQITSLDNQFATAEYSDDNIITLEGLTHIRRRAGMYIGKLGDGSHSDDGIYVLIKETIDNCIDEFRMNEGKVVEVSVSAPSAEDNSQRVRVRDYGRGIPLGKIVEVVSILNTGGKYDTKAFKKSVGLNGVGTKAVNALSLEFVVQVWRDGKTRRVVFKQGHLVEDSDIQEHNGPEKRGTLIEFVPDNTRGLFENYRFRDDFIETMMRNYAYLNVGLTLSYNGKKYSSKNGLFDLLTETMTVDPLYPIIHIQGEDIEIALTHTDQTGEEYHSFVNGQHTIQGGTHQAALREAIGRTIKEFYGKNYDYSDIRSGIIAAIAINVQEPQFESQTKIKLGSLTMEPNGGISVNKFVGDFIKTEVDNFLHKNLDLAEVIEEKIKENERDRKAIAGVTKLARERAKTASLHNRKLRDCNIHYNDTLKANAKEDLRELTSIFVTEGDSASGSITKTRDVDTQAVFSLRGKPYNSYGQTKKVVYVSL